MPVKRRRSKARELTEWKIEELHHGPGTCLLAGLGYWRGAFFDRLPDAEREDVIAEMRSDWRRHAPRVLAAWQDRTYPPSDGSAEPWALREFGND